MTDENKKFGVDEIDILIQDAVGQADLAAHEFEGCGENTYGSVEPGFVNFQTSVGRARVALLRAEINLFKAQLRMKLRSKE